MFLCSELLYANWMYSKCQCRWILWKQTFQTWFNFCFSWVGSSGYVFLYCDSLAWVKLQQMPWSSCCQNMQIMTWEVCVHGQTMSNSAIIGRLLFITLILLILCAVTNTTVSYFPFYHPAFYIRSLLSRIKPSIL